MNILKERRTIRQFTNKKIPREVLEEIINAAMCSPSAQNKQGHDITVVTNQTKLNDLSKVIFDGLSSERKNIFEDRKKYLKVVNTITGDAPAIFFIHRNGRSIPEFCDIEAGIIAMSIIVGAKDKGLETMPLGCVKRSENKKEIEKELGIEEGSLSMGIAAGYSIDFPAISPKDIQGKWNIID
jgi:FMN reductase [NAD(P)H]